MQITATTIAILLAAATNGLAQGKSPAKLQKAMGKLSFLEGQWKGTAKLSFGPGKSTTATVDESATFKLQRQILVIEGRGTAKLPNGTSRDVHNAYGVISYDAAAGDYRFRTYRVGGEVLDPTIKVEDNNIVWSFKHPRAGTVRFSTTVKDGVWTETGEASRDGGKTWFNFFEMNLNRVKSK